MTRPSPRRRAVTQPGREPGCPGSQPYAGSTLWLLPHMVPAPGGAGNASGGEQSSMILSQKICPFLLLAASSYAGALG